MTVELLHVDLSHAKGCNGSLTDDNRVRAAGAMGRRLVHEDRFGTEG